MTTQERNEKVRQTLNALYEKAINAGVEIDESAYKESLDKLFSTTAWGFREILLVVVVAMKLENHRGRRNHRGRSLPTSFLSRRISRDGVCRHFECPSGLQFM